MKMWILLVLASFALGASAQSCSCETMKWATCDGNPCSCSVLVDDNVKQTLDCDKLIPKCFLMKAEMYRAKNKLDTRTVGGKPVETAFVDNDGIYDPDCENDGKFRAKQCNNTDECWCVNSAGVRRTDKGDKDLKCEKLVETHFVRLQLTHKPTQNPVKAEDLKTAIAEAINKRYKNFNKDLVKEVQYDPDARMIVVDVKKEIGDRTVDLTQMAYYMEKDVKVLPLFRNQDKFKPNVGGQSLDMENILVYYVDEEAPTFTMKNLSGGIIAVIVVVVLAVVIGLVLLFFLNKRGKKRYNKTQQREMEAM
ncbi:LOW QUALITY PROTEIN: tumor-associated calcium signal transducer 2-like [Takifugu flavidus]|uniref:LOW QUALITY PROTEIN: tumor-associated calcium signal transducer 2-like n=1 Tax=Takifugu flavidus TaxID=433684 RepID=UPI0025445B5A|nr:LOW QUALITY PROTEIN: tumor-associated calcium signal transducer 2-like [Takifugu flavidus]